MIISEGREMLAWPFGEKPSEAGTSKSERGTGPGPFRIAQEKPVRQDQPRLSAGFERNFELEKLSWMAERLDTFPAARKEPLRSRLQLEYSLLRARVDKGVRLEEALGQVQCPSVRSLLDRPELFGDVKRALPVSAAQMTDEARRLANERIDRTRAVLSRRTLPPEVVQILKTEFRPDDQEELDEAVQALRKQLPQIQKDEEGINSSAVTYGWNSSAVEAGGSTSKIGNKTELYRYVYRQTLEDYPDVTLLAHTLIHESLHRLNWWWWDPLSGDTSGSTWFPSSDPDTYTRCIMKIGARE